MNTPAYPFILRRLATVLAVVILTLTLLAALSGILLAFYYEPTAGGAYNSLKTIATQVPNGAVIRSLHNIAGNGLIVVALIEIIVMFLGRKFSPSWFASWVSGVLLVLVGIGLGWTAMILDWSQVGYWRFRIELGTIEAIPLIGMTLRTLLAGDGAVNTITVQHLYTLHSYILAAGAVVLSVVHLAAQIFAAKPSAEEIGALDEEVSRSNAFG